MINCGEWPRVKIGDVVSTVTGSTPSTKNPEFYGEHILFVKPPDLIDSRILSASDSLSELGASTGRVVPAGSVLVSCIGNLGKIGLATQSISFNQQINAIVADEKFDPKFMFYQAMSPDFKLQLEKLSSGTTVSIVNKSKFNSIKIVLPPLKIQKRIVAVLDEAFADIDKARELTERNLKNARELFESYLQQIFKGVTSSDSVMRLKDLVTSDCSLSYGIVQPGDNIDGGVPVVRPVDLTSEILYRDGLKRVLPKVSDGYKKTILRGDELLLCVRGSTGKFSMAHPELAGANVTRGIVPIRFDDNRIEKRFAFYQFLSPIVQKQIKAATYGAALMQINIRDLKKIKMVVPTLENQRKIIGRLEAVYPELLRTAEIYENKLKNLYELKSAVLERSFQYHSQ